MRAQRRRGGVVAVVVLATVTACSDAPDDSADEPSPSPSPEGVVTVVEDETWQAGTFVPVSPRNRVPSQADTDEVRWIYGLDGDAHECGADATGLVFETLSEGGYAWACTDDDVEVPSYQPGDSVPVLPTDLTALEEYPDYPFVYATPAGDLIGCEEESAEVTLRTVDMGDAPSEDLWACSAGSSTIAYGALAFGGSD